MGRNLQRFSDIAIAENNKIVLGLFYESAVMKDCRRDFVAGIKARFDLRQADLDPLLLENICKAAFRQTALERHLAALESGTAAVTRTRFLPFMTATRGLTE